jgi:hypothetical protein
MAPAISERGRHRGLHPAGSEVKTTNVAGLTLDFARRLEVLRQVRGRDHVTPFGGHRERSLLELEA